MNIINSRYPNSGTAKATGDNIIELAYGRPGINVSRIHAVVTGDATVKANGHLLSPVRELGGKIKEYEHNHKVCDDKGQRGGIGSLTIKGDAVFFVEFS